MSDKIKGGVIKKSIRAFLTVMRRLLVDFPLDVVGDDEFKDVLADMGKRGVKRPMEEVDPMMKQHWRQCGCL